MDATTCLEFIEIKNQFGDNLNEEMTSSLKEWERAVVNIAVIGETYVGKSSHINAHFGNYAATAGHAGDTTQEVTPYGRNGPIDLSNADLKEDEVLIFWDLPGFNTIKFNKKTYDEHVNLDRYNFFLILTDKIFTHDIHWLLGEILRRNKRFFLVRTKIDQAIDNARKHPPRQTPEQVMETIRNKIGGALQESVADFESKNPGFQYVYDPENFKVYFVENHDASAYDFPQLRDDIFGSMTALQKEVYLIQCRSYTKKMRDEKYKNFKKRILKVSAASAAGAPIPGSTLLFDVPLISYEVFQYMKVFGIDKQTIREIEQDSGLDRDRIETPFKEYLRKSHKALYAIRETIGEVKSIKIPELKHLAPGIIGALTLIAASGTAETAAEATVPILGVAIASMLSFGTTYTQLRWRKFFHYEDIFDSLNIFAYHLRSVDIRWSFSFQDETRKIC